MNNDGRIETCGCCGKDIKRPVYSKRLGMYLGKDCFAAIQWVRTGLYSGLDIGTEQAKKNYPKSYARLVELARGGVC